MNLLAWTAITEGFVEHYTIQFRLPTYIGIMETSRDPGHCFHPPLPEAFKDEHRRTTKAFKWVDFHICLVHMSFTPL